MTDLAIGVCVSIGIVIGAVAMGILYFRDHKHKFELRDVQFQNPLGCDASVLLFTCKKCPAVVTQVVSGRWTLADIKGEAAKGDDFAKQMGIQL